MGRSANTGHNILALRVQQKLAVEILVADRRITRKSDARTASFSQVAEHHRLHINRCAEIVRDVVDAAIMLRPIVLPRAKYGVTRHHKLFFGILREVALGVLLDDLLVLFDDFLQRLGVKVGIELRLLLLFLAVENVLKLGFIDVEHDVAEHLDQSAVGVVRKPRIVRQPGQCLHALVVQPEVQDRIHHARHGKLRA